MSCIRLLIPVAFIALVFATAEEDEDVNKLMDTLVNSDDETQDQMVDMIAEKLVDKLLGFDVAMLPQAAAVQAPPAMVRQMPSFRAAQPTAPGLVPVGYDNSKNVKIGENREGVVASRNKNYNAVPDSTTKGWGIGASSNGRSANPYAVAYPAPKDRPEKAELNKPLGKSLYKPGPEYQNFGSSEYEKLMGKEGFGAARPMDKALDTLQGINRVDGGNKPKLMEMDESDGPDAVTVIATFLLSAVVGSAVTLALVRFGRHTKTGMKAPLLM